MLITEKIEIIIVSKNFEYFNNLGYNVKCKDKINISVKELPNNSHHKIKVQCDICGKEKEIKYREHINQHKLHNFDTCKKCSQVKNKITKIEKYGNLNNIEKIKKTNLLKYGVEHFGNRKKCFETFINKGRWTKIEDRSDFYKYYLLVYSKTMKNKKELLNNWNGYDYYSNEYIFENFNLNSNDKNYPTIDHKNSIKYGFDNKISAEEISHIDNLCLTTRSNNSSKGDRIESNFIPQRNS